MDMSMLYPAAGIVAVTLYLLLVCTVALIAAGHRDRARRADAARVLDRLLRAGEAIQPTGQSSRCMAKRRALVASGDSASIAACPHEDV